MTLHREEWHVLALCVLCVLNGLVVGWAMTHDSCRREAIKHGAAQWTIDQKGIRHFRWNDEVKP